MNDARIFDKIDFGVLSDLLIQETIFYKGIMPSEVGFRFSSGL